MGSSTTLTPQERRQRAQRMEAGRRRAARERATAARQQLRADLAEARQRLRRAQAEMGRAEAADARAWAAYLPHDGTPGCTERAAYTRMRAASARAHTAAMAHLACWDRVRLLEQRVAAQRAPHGAGAHHEEAGA